MTFRNIFLAITILLFTLSSAVSQTRNAAMAFDEEAHNFGNVNEQDGDLKHTFAFRNTGADTIIINNVRATCGCTTPNWTSKPIVPGEKGEIDVVYHVKNRPGSFNKSIIVYSNAENSPVTLKISGNVSPKPKTVADEYRYLIDKLRFKKTNAHFSEMYQDESRVDMIEFINVSEEDVSLKLTDKHKRPEHIRVDIKPETVAPGKTGTISISYDASKKNDWDYVRDYIMFDVNGQYDSRYRMVISANIKERFSEEDLKNPPAIEFITPEVFEFGNIEKGEKIEHAFKFKNTGKSDLIIRKVRASCGCTATTTGKDILKPGEESTIKTVFDSTHKRGAQNNTITVITNIPGKTAGRDNSRIILTMKGNVQEN